MDVYRTGGRNLIVIDFVAVTDGKKRNVSLVNEQEVIVENIRYKIYLSKINETVYLLKVNNKVYEIAVSQLSNETYSFLVNGYSYELSIRTKLQEKAIEILGKRKNDKKEKQIKAPMPGLVLQIKINIGDEIKVGDPLIVLEAMKMENEIRSQANGVIKEIFVKEGLSVEKNEILLNIE